MAQLTHALAHADWSVQSGVPWCAAYLLFATGAFVVLVVSSHNTPPTYP